uniref:Uncharacterized protein n=1 Tax=Arundo donax TaxID=35708 RepID=A0A0A9N567_ARUDO
MADWQTKSCGTLQALHTCSKPPNATPSTRSTSTQQNTSTNQHSNLQSPEQVLLNG